MSRLYDAMRTSERRHDQRPAVGIQGAIDAIEAEVQALMDGPWNALKEATREVVTLDGVLDGVQRQDD